MKSLQRKCLLTGFLSLCLAPAMFGSPARSCDHFQQANCQATAVPEGGSSMTYLLGAVVICAGAMLARFRMQRPEIQ
jgi:hypothetical protein